MCGIFGVIGKEPIAESIYHGLIQLQHRGQDAAGIFTYDPETGHYTLHKDLGLVKDIFTTATLPPSQASWGIGHVRYSTIGKGSQIDAQPLLLQYPNLITMAHNGNVINYVALRKELEQEGVHFKTFSDLEVMLHLFARTLPHGKIDFNDLCEAGRCLHERLDGAYSLVTLIGGVGMIALRDPKGMRPLLMGVKRKGSESVYSFGSENNALSVLGFEEITDVQPGEMVFIDQEMCLHRKRISSQIPALCSFEHNYFSKSNSFIDGKEVYQCRKRLGESLAAKIKEAGIQIDAVVPIPTTARVSAIALARSLGIYYEEGFVKQDHIGRTFIMPIQGIRQTALSRKLAAVSSVFKGRRVILVDDSIVRGTVSNRVISLARWAGAERVYFASTFPPIRFPCLYGIDFAHKEQLIASGKTEQEVCDAIRADGLFYNDVEALQHAVGTQVCMACVTGKYPTAIQGQEELQHLRRQDLDALEAATLLP